MKKGARWTVGIVLGFALLITFLWQNENRRGKRLWEETCARLRAAGEPVELADIIPPMIPDEENVAAAPIFAEVFANEKSARLTKFSDAFGRSPVRTTKSPPVPCPRARPLYPDDMSHLDEWRDFLRDFLSSGRPTMSMAPADEILHYLSRWDGETQELRKALQRPKCRWPLRYENGVSVEGPIPGLVLGILIGERPRLLAEAAKGDVTSCTETLLADFRLVRATGENGRLLGVLLNATYEDAMVLKSLQHIFPVVQFKEPQLAALQQQLSMISLAPVSQALRQERVIWSHAMQHFTIDELSHIHDSEDVLPFSATPREAQQLARSVLLLAVANRPEGWQLIDAADYMNFMHDEVEACVDVAAGTILLSRVNAMEIALEVKRNAAGRISLMRDFPDYFGSVLKREANRQALAREAGLWCALERYRLKNGHLPNGLGELVPEFVGSLPCDPVNGLPLRYVRKGENDYLLYSIGWNGIDDGGVESKRDRGDWVWASDPRLIVNPEEEKRKADEAARKSEAQRDAEWKEAMEKRNAQLRAKEQINKRERAKAADAGSK